MDAVNYLVLVNTYLVLFYGFYFIFLKDETFFKLNRIYLVGGASISFLIPFLQSDWVRALFITKQVEEVTQTFSMNLMGDAVIIPAPNQGLETGEIVLLIYFAGASICLLRFLWQLYQMKSILNIQENGQAFSFFNKVKVGSDILNRDTIYGHELVHARQWHSADVILFEIICIINWFNPVVYFYRKAIKHIHEFTADEIASKQEESKSAYALVLLSQTFGIPTHQLTNSFYTQSLLKRRIIMLHKSKSTRNALLKYGLSAPLFAAMMILSSASIKSQKVAKGITEVSSEAMNLIQPGDSTESDYQQFLKRNPPVEALEWKTFTYVTVVLKNGRRENYSLNRPEELKKAEGLYGSFPQAPPPPPPTQMANTPQTSLNKEDGPLFTQVEVSPEFPGGMQAFYAYFAKEFKYPKKAIQDNVSGKIFLQFIVDTTGKIENVKVLRGLGSGMDEEAVKLLENSPNWRPGIQNGRRVRVQYTLPVSVNNPSNKTGSVNKTYKDDLAFSADSKSKLYVVDGKVVSSGIMKGIDQSSIKAVNVLKGEQGVKKYGDQGKDGVIEIYVKNTPNISASGSASADKRELLNGIDIAPDQNGNVVVTGKSPFKGLVVINGKEALNDDGKAFRRIKSEDIESVNVLKEDEAIKQYGDRGRNGVIQITLKKK